jgi:hypothetical protein
MSDQAHDAKITALENALGALVPAPGQINRDQVMFRAGRASVKALGWVWPAAAGTMALVAAVFGGMLALRPDPEPKIQIVYITKEVPRRAPTDPEKSRSRPPGRTSAGHETEEPAYPQTPYFQMENNLLRWGLDSLPASPPAPPSKSSPTRAGIWQKPAEGSSPVFLFPLTLLQ